MPNTSYKCCCQNDPCLACKPASDTSDPPGTAPDPNSAMVTVAAACMNPADDTFAYDSYSRVSPTGEDYIYCRWSWTKNTPDTFGAITAYYIVQGSVDLEQLLTQGGTIAGTATAGQWVSQLAVETVVGGNFHDGEWIKITDGIICDPDAGKVSGTVAFAAADQTNQASGDCIGLASTITVPA